MLNARSVFAGMITAVAIAADAPLVKPAVPAKIAGYMQLFPAGPDFRTAASVEVTAEPNKYGESIKKASDAERSSNGGTSAVMAVVGKSVPNAQPAENGAPGAGQRIAFKESWNSAQGWATMRGNGLPFLDMQTFGKASAAGTAAWNAKLVMPQAHGLFVTFTLPEMKVFGTLEQDGPSTYQGRMRTELLVNGHSVWTSEANRINTLLVKSDNVCTASPEASTQLTQFGAATGLSSNTPSSAAAEKSVTLSLGQFAAGDAIEVSLIVRADSQVNRKCCIKVIDGVSESFCTGVVTQVGWSNAVNPVVFRVGPVI